MNCSGSNGATSLYSTASHAARNVKTRQITPSSVVPSREREPQRCKDKRPVLKYTKLALKEYSGILPFYHSATTVTYGHQTHRKPIKHTANRPQWEVAFVPPNHFS